MKKTFVTILFTLFIAPLAVFGADINIKIKGIGVYSTYAAVIKQFGKPLKITQDSRNECVGEDEMYIEYDGVQMSLLGDKKTGKFRVSGIDITAPHIILTPAVKIGMTPKQIQAKFGKPDSKDNEENALRWSYQNIKETSYAMFVFKNGKLVEIRQQEYVC